MDDEDFWHIDYPNPRPKRSRALFYIFLFAILAWVGLITAFVHSCRP